MEKELAKRLAAKAARGELPSEVSTDRRDVSPAEERIEPAPDSGVRTSGPFGVAPLDAEPARPLTYSVYTVSDLEARPPRLSMAAYSAQPQPSRWADTRKSGLVVLRALWAWVRTSKPRPRPMDVLRGPLTVFTTDLRVALRDLPWKKIGWASAFAFGAITLFLFAIVTVAELTDDLRPARSVSASTADPASVAVLTGAPAPVVGIAERAAYAASPPVEAEPAQIELDDDAVEARSPEPPAQSSVGTGAPQPKRGATVKKPKPVEIFIP
jgi:hypothetical protein